MKTLSPKQREAARLVAEGKFFPDFVREDDGWHARWFPVVDAGGARDGALDAWVDEYVRAANVTRLSEDAEDQRHETLHDAWLMALRSRTGLVRWDEAACAAFAAELKEWHGAAAEDVAARRALVFRFVAEGEKFFLVCDVPKGRRSLRALGMATFVVGALRGLKADWPGAARPSLPAARSSLAVMGGLRPPKLTVELSRAEAESFIRSGARELVEAGYQVVGVDLAAQVTAEAEIGEGLPEQAAAPSAAPIAARLVVKVDGEAVGAEEIRFLLEQKSTLVFFRDRWIEVDRNILKEALRALEKSTGKTLTVNEAIGFARGVGAFGRLEIEEVRAHGWLRGLVNELAERSSALTASRTALSTGSDARAELGLRGELRPYQRRGVFWMKFLTDHGFGALLADDMGLGKTIQTIGWMLASPSDQPFLVVAPLTLVANWRHELEKFAPGLRVYVHQGEYRQLAQGFKRAVAQADVVVTSYSLLVRDYAIVRETAWAGLVLDEAQAIKNPDTQVARAVRSLGARRRVALTGTPIENTVQDVWSIEEFLNPTFLGDRKRFQERFVQPLAANEQSAAGKRLRHALEPFVLRRLKTDPEIAGELGAKREIKEYCALMPPQRADYETALADYRASERRQGDVFALITRLKLVCDGEGKWLRLVDLLEAIFAAGESALVFTQYAKVGAWLKTKLEKQFGCAVPFLHGGLSATAREAEIAAFNAPGARAFILSLRAGGFGLNLTKATHVVHFDRWWNPAVESQATDRAHRIGQAKTVFVHAFITEGTLEEHVDELLERKARVAGSLVATGESFLKELTAAEFDRAVALDA